jgi:hypothetical protein
MIAVRPAPSAASLRQRHVLVALFVPALAAGIALAVVALVGTKPVPSSHERARSLVWSGRVFTSKGEFAAWLRSRRHSYAEWAKRHPGAAPWRRRPFTSAPDRDARSKPGHSHAKTIRLSAGLTSLLAGALAAALIVGTGRRAAARKRLAETIGVTAGVVAAAVTGLTRRSARAGSELRRLVHRREPLLPYALALLLNVVIGLLIALFLLR